MLASLLIALGITGAAKMADVLKKQKQAATPAAAPVAAGPKPLVDFGDPLDAYKRLKKRSGRADTILTGSYAPTDVARRTLLG